MRSVATVFMWVITTVLLAVALPAAWVQLHIVDSAGYSGLARQAAANPELQSAMAGELTAQVGRLAASADSTPVSNISRAYTASSSFPAQFGQANAFAHRWLFTDTVGSDLDEQGRWVIDFAPMLSDAAFSQTLSDPVDRWRSGGPAAGCAARHRYVVAVGRHRDRGARRLQCVADALRRARAR